jgi:diacylglycerol kinase family enzyme
MDLSNLRDIRRTAHLIWRWQRQQQRTLVVVAGGDGTFAWAMDVLGAQNVVLTPVRSRQDF